MSQVSMVISTAGASEALAEGLGDLRAAAGGGELLLVAPRPGEVEADGCRALPETAGADWATSMNAAVRAARGEWVLLLHEDLRVEPGFLAPLLQHRHEDDLFAVVPRVVLPREGGLIESVVEMVVEDGLVGLGRPSLRERERRWLRSGPVFLPSAACALYRREAFLRLGGFDPLFTPVAGAELDLGFRAWRRGMRVVYEPASIVFHGGSGSLERSLEARDEAALRWRDRLLFQWKNVTDPEWLRAQPATALALAAQGEVLGDQALLEGLDLALQALPLALKAREGEAHVAAARSDREILRDSAPAR
jgi:hypothetical protein